MNSIDSFPPDDAPLRAKLPNVSPITVANLIRWGACQPGAQPWIMKRAARYWEQFPEATDSRHLLIDATAALDLLRHRIITTEDREAVSHLNAHPWPDAKHDPQRA